MRAPAPPGGTVYLVDGSAESFYTAVFDAFQRNETGATVTGRGNTQLSLLCPVIEVAADPHKAGRILTFLRREAPAMLQRLRLALRSGRADKYNVAYRFLRVVFAHKSHAYYMAAHPDVAPFLNLEAQVTGEAHLMKGFIRFGEQEDGVFYAVYRPDHDVTALVMPHFIERFGSQRFIIHDEGRNVLGLYNGHESVVFEAKGALTVRYSAAEDRFIKLWQLYYRSINIASRRNQKLMLGFMPRRYHKYMPERDG